MKQVAIVGAGAVSQLCHLPAIQKNLKAEASVIIDTNEERAKILAASFSVPRVLTDFRAIPEYADAVICAAPHHLHVEIGTFLLNEGLHVLMEKPLATTYDECRQLWECAEKNQRVLGVGLMRRFLHAARLTKWLIEKDVLGDIREVDAREGNIFNWPVRSPFQFRKESGGGVLFDTGAHTLDLLLWWLGDIDEVEYEDDAHGGVEADAHLRLHFARGTQGQVELSRTRDLRNTAILYGSKAKLEVSLRENRIALRTYDEKIGFLGEGLPPSIKPMGRQGFFDLFPPQLQNWLDAIEGQAELAVRPQDAARSVAIVEKAYAAKKPLVYPWKEGKGKTS